MGGQNSTLAKPMDNEMFNEHAKSHKPVAPPAPPGLPDCPPGSQRFGDDPICHVTDNIDSHDRAGARSPTAEIGLSAERNAKRRIIDRINIKLRFKVQA